jgi:hypothetical protein
MILLNINYFFSFLKTFGSLQQNVEAIKAMYDSGAADNAESELSKCSPHDVSRSVASCHHEGQTLCFDFHLFTLIPSAFSSCISANSRRLFFLENFMLLSSIQFRETGNSE